MQQFSITNDQVVLCNTPLCWSELRRFGANAELGPTSAAPIEVVLCAVDGDVAVEVADERFQLTAMQGLQLPAGTQWAAQTGDQGAKILRVDSPHPGFDPARRLMEPLARSHQFAIADKQMLVYTDYVRGGVLNFAPKFTADKHFHQAADEIFWFFQGTCRVTTPDGATSVPAGSIILTPAGEWHIIENVGDEPLLMFLTVTPNIVPSHTFFHPDGSPWVRSWEPLRRR